MPYIDSDDDSNELIKPGGFMNLFMINLKTIVIDSNNNKTYNNKQLGYICFNTKTQMIFSSWNELERIIRSHDNYRNHFEFYSINRKIPFNNDYYEIIINSNFKDQCYTREIQELSGGKRKR